MLSSIGRAAARRLASRPIATSFVSPLASRPVAEQAGLGWVASRFAKACSLRDFATQSAATQTEEPPAKGRTKRATTEAGAKSKAKTKTAKPKEKKKKVTKKPLTPEQESKIKLKEYKDKSLYKDEPKQYLPGTAYRLFVSEHGKYGSFPDLIARMEDCTAKWKTVSSTELERLTREAEENRLKNAATYKAWVESKPLQQILDANNARNKLKAVFNYPKSAKRLIKDDRLIKRPLAAFSYFTKARWASGDFTDRKASGVALELAAEWKNMSEAEKQPYIELARADAHRYHREMEAANLPTDSRHKSH